ncbi:hypothetical protein AB4068_00940 [Arthrobacter sp. 2RAF22]|uniref:hypothetical protein n=1 Tax=Arthrobacter sp. 2RAF22 TaxID=3232996 RepID=UPI003F936F17
MSDEAGNLPLILVCSRRGSHTREILGGLYMTDVGVVIGFAEKDGRGPRVAYRQITVTGNHGKTFYEADDHTAIEVRCYCKEERDLRTDRLAAMFGKDGAPLRKTLDISII